MQLDVNTIHKWTENDYTELQEKFESITLNSLTMGIYIPREGWYQINQFNHGDLYVKRVSGYH